jgi:hypothetical protein
MKQYCVRQVCGLLFAVFLFLAAGPPNIRADSSAAADAVSPVFLLLRVSPESGETGSHGVPGGVTADPNFAVQVAQLYAFPLTLEGASNHDTADLQQAPDFSEAAAFRFTNLSTEILAASLWPFFSEQVEATLVPEPATLMLLASGFTVLALANRRLRR